MNRLINLHKCASAALILVLVLTSFFSSFDARVLADDRVKLSQYDTIVSDDNGRKLIRGGHPVKPPKVKMPAVTLPQPPAGHQAAAAPAAFAARSDSDASASGAAAASSSTSPYAYTAGTATILTNVPAFTWCYGCSATAAAMLFGYYDRTGYGNMYTGPTNGGVCPLDNSSWGSTTYTPSGVICGECPISATHQGKDGRATRGHVDDYWIDYGNPGPDPYIVNDWTEHTPGDCTGDYMGTSQSKYSLSDGSTWFFRYENGDPLVDYTGKDATQRDGCHGMRLFAESRGYTVQTNFTQMIQGQASDPSKGFTFADYQAEINAGRPVIIQLVGHSMLGYGYDTATSKIYIHDTWNYLDHEMTWGGTYNSMQHYGVTVIRLEPVLPIPPTQLRDYDGDGKTDLAVYRVGTWFIQRSTTNTPYTIGWGTSSDKPVQHDYNGDGKLEAAIYRNGTWFINSSPAQVIGWGTTNDIPVPADYNGDGKAEPAVFRNGTWFINSSPPQVIGWGTANDIPVIR